MKISVKKTKFEKIWQNGKLQQFKQKTKARKWHASIKRCEMEKEVKNIDDQGLNKDYSFMSNYV